MIFFEYLPDGVLDTVVMIHPDNLAVSGLLARMSLDMITPKLKKGGRVIIKPYFEDKFQEFLSRMPSNKMILSSVLDGGEDTFNLNLNSLSRFHPNKSVVYIWKNSDAAMHSMNNRLEWIKILRDMVSSVVTSKEGSRGNVNFESEQEYRNHLFRGPDGSWWLHLHYFSPGLVLGMMYRIDLSDDGKIIGLGVPMVEDNIRVIPEFVDLNYLFPDSDREQKWFISHAKLALMPNVMSYFERYISENSKGLLNEIPKDRKLAFAVQPDQMAGKVAITQTPDILKEHFFSIGVSNAGSRLVESTKTGLVYKVDADAAMTTGTLLSVVAAVGLYFYMRGSFKKKKALVLQAVSRFQGVPAEIQPALTSEDIVGRIDRSPNLKKMADTIAHYRDDNQALNSIVRHSNHPWAVWLALDRLYAKPKRNKAILDQLTGLPINGVPDFIQKYRDLNNDIDQWLAKIGYSEIDIRQAGVNKILQGSVDKRLDFTAEKFILLLNASIYPAYRKAFPDLISEMENKILPQFETLKHPLTRTLRYLDDWLAYSLGGYHKDYVKRATYLSEMTDRPRASAIVWAGNGPHTRFLYTPDDYDDISAETHLINGFIGEFWKKMHELALKRQAGSAKEVDKLEKEVKRICRCLA